MSTTSVLPIISDYNSDLLSFRNTRCFFAHTTEMSLASLGRGCQNIFFVRPGWCLKPKANSKGWNIEIQSLLILPRRIGSAYWLHLEGGRRLRYTARVHALLSPRLNGSPAGLPVRMAATSLFLFACLFPYSSLFPYSNSCLECVCLIL